MIRYVAAVLLYLTVAALALALLWLACSVIAVAGLSLLLIAGWCPDTAELLRTAGACGVVAVITVILLGVAGELLEA